MRTKANGNSSRVSPRTNVTNMDYVEPMATVFDTMVNSTALAFSGTSLNHLKNGIG